MIYIKTEREIELMRRAGIVVGSLLHHLVKRLRPGMKTKALDAEARTFLREHGVQPAFVGYRGYPASICVSVNEEVVHGIPGSRELRDGDIVSIDAGAQFKGYFADAATTATIGPASPAARRLMTATRRALEAGIAQARVGRRLSDISHAVQRVIDQEGFGIVRDFVGHGIGRAIHEDPPIPNFGPPNTGPRLKAGMVLAIEPMVTLGSPDVQILSDGWTAVTCDGSVAAHYEHTVGITDSGAQILTDAHDTER